MQLKFVNRSGSVDLVLSDAFTEAEKFDQVKFLEDCAYQLNSLLETMSSNLLVDNAMVD